MHVAVIVNPIAGRGSPDAGQHRAAVAGRFLADRGVAHTIAVTERPGHGRELASQAVERGADVVCAWGGDGTVNEVATALVSSSSSSALAVVPAGSGNGFARDLGIPAAPAGALAVAAGSGHRRIDVGQMNERLFVNLAGVGFDALVARRFAGCAPGRRGLARYLAIAARELGSYRPGQYRISGSRPWEGRALMVVAANCRQYGNNAIIAPPARPDDGRLDLAVIYDLAVWRIFTRLPRLFRGTLSDGDGVAFSTFEALTIRGSAPLDFHVDGEPVEGTETLDVRVRPNALTVKVPAAGDSAGPL